jgi:predicted acylesterase/phospholipase RssA
VKELSRLPWRRHARGIGRAVRALPALVHRTPGGRRADFADVVYDLQAHLPGGLFSNVGIGALIERAASLHGRADRFDALLAPLLITASDLDSGERAVYGPGHDESAALSLAVRASTTIPMYFEPVRIGERHLIDGQIVDPAHMDLAAIEGTRAILVVSPLVPYRAKDAAHAPGVADLGVAAIMDQMARISASVKHRATRERVRREHPEIAICEFHPEPREALDLMRAGFRAESLIDTWKLGFVGAARTLRRDAPVLAELLAPLGVALSLDALEARAGDLEIG